ncbi:MAG: MarR family transcriptional regulator [Bacilli bacterium]
MEQLVYSELSQIIIKNKQIMENMLQVLGGDFGRGQLMVLMTIYQKKSISPTDISKILRVGTNRVACVLNEMESRKLIVRNASSLDKRRVTVSLTPEGVKTLEKMHQKIKSLYSEMVKSIGEEKAMMFNSTINEIWEFFDKKKGEAVNV